MKYAAMQKGSGTREGQRMQPCKQSSVQLCAMHGDEVPSMQCNDVNERCWDEPRQPCKQVPKEKVGMDLLKYTRIFPRMCARMFQRKILGQE